LKKHKRLNAGSSAPKNKILLDKFQISLLV